MKQKVLVYIIRESARGREVLVFAHRDFPESGLQVPAGTVDPGEPIEAAAYRDVYEESGLTAAQVRLVRKLAEAIEAEFDQNRHAFWFAPTGSLPDR